MTADRAATPSPSAGPAGPGTPSAGPAGPGTPPAGLAAWADTLDAISAELAEALAPLLLRLDRLIGEHDPVTAPHGEPDGYGGLARSGRPDQLPPAEWLLAEEFPEEFLRRLVDHELLYLAPRSRSTTGRGRTVVLVDAGPTQAGAGRLVQLAALLVLHQRAAARGGELLVGVLGDRPGRLFGGELPELLPRWLRSRRPTDPTPEDVRSAEQALTADDRVWLLASPRLSGQLPSRRRTLVAEEAGWGAAGASGVRVRVDGGADALLPLPPVRIAVRALRGAEFRHAATVAAPLLVTGGALPAFTTRAFTLLARGRKESVLLAVGFARGGEFDPAVRARRHELPGPVVAAGRNGGRLLALYVQRRRLRLYVSGRGLGEPGGYDAELTAFGLDPADRAQLAGLLAQPVLPLLKDGVDLLVPLAGQWRRIAPGGTVTADGPVVSTADGRPFRAAHEPRLCPGPIPPEAAGAVHLVHGGGAVAWSDDGLTWRLYTAQGRSRRIDLVEEAEVLGVVDEAGEPVLVIRTDRARLVQAVRADSVRTLTDVCGGEAAPAVHPLLPLVAAEPYPGRLLVADALTGRSHLLIATT
ncbi:hypothetical protein [Kitasatospora sp. NPDC097643]|uniref:hypothetical protein n=1 Tax=Kitasatospora sp. NPDC097643 TaxID=3157230 RepID=UPI00332DD516